MATQADDDDPDKTPTKEIVIPPDLAAAIAEWAAKYGVDVVKRAADKVS